MTAKKKSSKAETAKQPAKTATPPVQKTIEQGINEMEQVPPVEAVPSEKIIKEAVQAGADAMAEKNKKPTDSAIILTDTANEAAATAVNPDGHFEREGRPQFWNNNVYIPGTGTVNGKVTNSQKAAFFAFAPKNVKFDNFMGDVDLVQKRIDDAKAKAKRKSGQID